VPGQINWTDTDELAYQLYEMHPEVNPLDVRFTDLLDWVLKVPGFAGTREQSNEAKLEAIQMAWLEEWKDNQ
jgi:FeS assembly protein IscX